MAAPFKLAFWGVCQNSQPSKFCVPKAKWPKEQFTSNAYNFTGAHSACLEEGVGGGRGGGDGGESWFVVAWIYPSAISGIYLSSSLVAKLIIQIRY